MLERSAEVIPHYTRLLKIAYNRGRPHAVTRKNPYPVNRWKFERGDLEESESVKERVGDKMGKQELIGEKRSGNRKKYGK